RISNLCDSNGSWKALFIDRSRLLVFGARRILRPAILVRLSGSTMNRASCGLIELPFISQKPVGHGLNASRLLAKATDVFGALGLPIVGRSLNALRSLFKSNPPTNGLSTAPDCIRYTPEN